MLIVVNILKYNQNPKALDVTLASLLASWN